MNATVHKLHRISIKCMGIAFIIHLVGTIGPLVQSYARYNQTNNSLFYTQNSPLNVQYVRGGIGTDTGNGIFLDPGGGGSSTFMPQPRYWDGSEYCQLIFILVGIDKYSKTEEVVGAWADVILWTHWATALFNTLQSQYKRVSMTFYLFGYTDELESESAMPETPSVRETTTGGGNFLAFNLYYAKATKTNILLAVRNAVEDAHARTCVYFVFAGHGWKSKDQQQEGICVMDGIIKDYELQQAFYSYAIVSDNIQSDDYLYFFFDCCYSGGMDEVANIYAPSQVAFFAACGADETTEAMATESFVGHNFPDGYGVHGKLTMAFMQQYFLSNSGGSWDRQWNTTALLEYPFESCWYNEDGSGDIYTLITNSAPTDPYGFPTEHPVFIDGNAEDGYFYAWWHY